MRWIGCTFVIGLMMASNAAEAGKKKKSPEPTAPGWYQQDGWMGSCYKPHDFAAMAAGPKRVAWQEAREAMLSQWRGERSDGISFDERAIESAETAMLGKPERIEAVLAKNHELCVTAMSGKGGGAWGSWVQALAGELTEGECPSPKMSFTLYDYLSINDEWHIPVGVCRGDKVRIHATDGDEFRLAADGKWINAAGDTSEPASGGLPCTLEGCYRGQVVMRFTAVNGVQVVKPVGLETTFTAPDHGKIEVMINDDSLSDNAWKVEKGIEHHTGIEYKPAEK